MFLGHVETYKKLYYERMKKCVYRKDMSEDTGSAIN